MWIHQATLFIVNSLVDYDSAQNWMSVSEFALNLAAMQAAVIEGQVFTMKMAAYLF